MRNRSYTTEKRREYKENMLRYGFGAAAAKQMAICDACGSPCSTDDNYCKECGTKLSGESLYKKATDGKPTCPRCRSLIGRAENYCSVCGAFLRNENQAAN